MEWENWHSVPGYEFTAENTYVRKTGRGCRACTRKGATKCPN